MSIAFLHILCRILCQVFTQEKTDSVEKYVRKRINSKPRVIEIDLFQTIVGNISQEISRFNLRWTISFFFCANICVVLF